MTRLDGRRGRASTPCEPHGDTARSESSPHPIVLMAALLFAVAVSFAPAQQPAIAPAPVPGPVGLSVGNEARTALLRADRWLRRNAPDVPDAPLPPPDEDELTRLLPLLQGESAPGSPQENRYESLLRLATALADRGTPVVFLPDGTSVPWRNAILHDLVTTQTPDDRGGGYWTTLPDAPADDILRSTRAATAALRFLLGGP